MTDYLQIGDYEDYKNYLMANRTWTQIAAGIKPWEQDNNGDQAIRELEDLNDVIDSHFENYINSFGEA